MENENQVEETNETEDQGNVTSIENEEQTVTPEPVDIRKEQDDLLEYCFKAAVKLHLQER